jgi:hypothetical protein
VVFSSQSNRTRQQTTIAQRTIDTSAEPETRNLARYNDQTGS